MRGLKIQTSTIHRTALRADKATANRVSTCGYAWNVYTRLNCIRYPVDGWWLNLSNHRSKSWSESVLERSHLRLYGLYEVCTYTSWMCLWRHPTSLANLDWFKVSNIGIPAFVPRQTRDYGGQARFSPNYTAGEPAVSVARTKEERVKAYIFFRRARAIWRLTSRCLMSARLSCFFLPLAKTTFSFTRRLVVYKLSGSNVKPGTLVLPIK